jgi:predicted DNA-binding protein (MmcQ/YjbR family)
MNIADLQAICLALPGVTQDIKWENHLCFSVGGKLFLITSPDEVPVTASFKASPEDFQKLCQRSGIVPAPYLARNHWVMAEDITVMNRADWKSCLHMSYALIASKLPARVRQSLEAVEKRKKKR